MPQRSMSIFLIFLIFLMLFSARGEVISPTHIHHNLSGQGHIQYSGLEYPTTCRSHTLSAAEWHTRFWCAYTSITMEHHLAARTNAFFTFLLPPACHVPWSTHWVLTGCSLDYSLDYSLTTHLTTHLVLTWCSLGAHRVLTGCSLTQLGSPAMMHLQSCTTVPNNEKHAFRCRGVSKNRCSRTPYGIQHMLWM